MRARDFIIRIGYTMLGALLMLCIVLVKDEYFAEEESIDTRIMEEVTAGVTELPIIETIEESLDFEKEAEEKLAWLQQQAQKRQQEEVEKSEAVSQNEIAIQTVSANSIEAAPVKWVKDYPKINSTLTLEEKLAERSSYEETLAVNAFDKKVIENSTIDFSDVKITILGDSLTEASNLSEEEQEKYAYPVVLKEILGCKEIVDLSKGGSSVSRAGDYAMVERFSDIPKDTDILIVFGGSNDCLFENKWEFGHIEYDKRMNKETFCGDLDEMVSAIEWVYRDHNEENYVKFLYINPPSTILNDAVYAIDPGNMVQQKSFAEAINAIVPAYEFEVIDLYNNNILNSHDRDVNEQFVPDGIHMSPEGYRILAEHIASQIIQRIEQ